MSTPSNSDLARGAGDVRSAASASRKPWAMLPALCISLAAASAARADGLAVPPVTLPATPTGPHLWFDGSPAALADLGLRKLHARTSASYNAFKAYVSARLASINSADDDTRATFAKSAALLHAMGETPATGPWPTYRDAAVAAIIGLGSRQPTDSIAELQVPVQPGLLYILFDASRLQSVAEAYDMLRGSGVSPADDTSMRAKIDNWAEAFRTDWNLAGYLIYPGHRDNWAIKGGSALVTCALALPDHPHAAAWLASGRLFVSESLTAVASETGYYREGASYLNYALNNLWSTAWHVRNATGVDWIEPLRALVDFAFALRQPDGRGAPFEEGLGYTFPWNVMASAYPDLAPMMLWAWDESPMNVENYDNQSAHDVTRFLLIDLDTVSVPPSTSPTRFVGDDTRLIVLATSWADDALQVSGLTADDHSTSEAFTSRHNQRNPLDLVIHGFGAVLVPTASGGPQVTNSTQRVYYLEPQAKNIPLLNSNAPFIVAAHTVALTSRLDSADEGPLANHFADLARTTVIGAYAGPASSFSRGLALIDESFVVITDRVALPSAGALGLSWRGRGVRTQRGATASLISETWDGAASVGSPQWGAPAPVATIVAPVALDVTSSRALSVSASPHYYSDAWNDEEQIDGVVVQTSANAATAAFISIYQPGASPRAVTAASNAGAAAASLDLGASTITVVAPESGFATAAGVGTDGNAVFVQRLSSGALTRFCVEHATSLVVDGASVLNAAAPVTLCATLHPDTLVAELSPDSADVSVTFQLPMLDGRSWTGTVEGVAVGVSTTGTSAAVASPPAGTLLLVPTAAEPCDDAATRCDDTNACTDDSCDPTTGVCSNVVRTCPGDAQCRATATCVPETGACSYVDGPLPVVAGEDPDGLFCTVAERCDQGSFSVSARDCGEPVDRCALASVCDEDQDACVDTGAVACEEQTLHIVVSDATGTPVGSVTCYVNAGLVDCLVGQDGRLIVTPGLVCE